MAGKWLETGLPFSGFWKVLGTSRVPGPLVRFPSHRLATGAASRLRSRLLRRGIALADVILGRSGRGAGRAGVGVEPVGHHRFDPAVIAHFHRVDPGRVLACEHPVPAFELRGDALDRAFGAERLAAADAVERLLLLDHPARRAPGVEDEAGVQRDHNFKAGRRAEAALNTDAVVKVKY